MILENKARAGGIQSDRLRTLVGLIINTYDYPHKLLAPTDTIGD